MLFDRMAASLLFISHYDIIEAGKKMEKNSDVKPSQRQERRNKGRKHFCNVCGKTSESPICDECAERIRMEVLWRKKREEQGNSWSPWE